MLIAYSPVFESSKWNEPDNQPRLCVDQAGNFLLTLTTKDFDVVYKDGKAEVTLARHMTNEQLKAFAQTLLAAADDALQRDKEWVMATSSELLVSADVACPACDGSGKVE